MNTIASAESDWGSITINRTSGRDIKVRNLYVQLDDEAEQNLKFGNSLNFEVAPGLHQIKVSNRLFTERLTVELQPLERLAFVGGNVAAGCLFTPFMVITGMGAYKVILERENASAHS